MTGPVSFVVKLQKGGYRRCHQDQLRASSIITDEDSVSTGIPVNEDLAMPLPTSTEESVPSTNNSDQNDQDDVPTNPSISNGLTHQDTTITPPDTPIPRASNTRTETDIHQVGMNQHGSYQSFVLLLLLSLLYASL